MAILGKLSDKQKFSIRTSNKRINIWEGSVRSSKTVASIIRLVKEIGSNIEGDGFILGRTERTVYRNVVKPLMDYVGSDATYNRAYGELRLWGRTMFVFGSNDKNAESKLRGMTAAIGYGDELTLIHEDLFRTALGRLSIEGAKFFGTTNPAGPKHWFKREWLDRSEYLDIAVFHFQLEDNIHLPKSYVDALKKEYTGVWYKRFILGLWVAAEGLVYDMFDEEKHVIPKAPHKNDIAGIVLGVDYGTTNPFVIVSLAFNKDLTKIWCIDEFVYDSTKTGRQKTDAHYREDVYAFAKRQPKWPLAMIVDPSAASFKVEMRRPPPDGLNGLVCYDADNSVADGIRNHARLLASGVYSILSKCVNTWEDYYAYLWDEHATEKGKDAPIKDNDHTKDAERYALMWLAKMMRSGYLQLTGGPKK